jgi:hypothetical protein
VPPIGLECERGGGGAGCIAAVTPTGLDGSRKTRLAVQCRAIEIYGAFARRWPMLQSGSRGSADRDQEIDRLLALGTRRPASARLALNPGLSLPAGGKRVLRSPPEGNAHPMRLSTENRRQTLSAA